MKRTLTARPKNLEELERFIDEAKAIGADLTAKVHTTYAGDIHITIAPPKAPAKKAVSR